MSARPMVLAVHFPAQMIDATGFAADEWTRCEATVIVKGAPFQARRLCLVPSEWVRIFGVKVGPVEVLSLNYPDASAPSSMFPVWTQERAGLGVEGFQNLAGRVAYPGESITVAFECRPAVFPGLAGVILGDAWLP